MTKTKENHVETAVLFLILFLANSFVICNNIVSSLTTIALWVVLFFLLIIGRKTIKRSIFISTILITISMTATVVFRNEDIITLGMVLFSYVVSLLYVMRVDFNRFCMQYSKIMYLLCIVSLIGFISFRAFPALYKINQVTTYTTYSNLYIYVDTPRYNRNLGMFWEPGAFQTFINIALLIELSYKGNKFDYKRIAIYIITIITTYSTTGYLTMFLILLTLFLKKSKSNGTKKFVVALTIAILFAIYFGQDYLFGKALSNGQSTVFGKIANYLSGKQVQSVSVRYYAIVKPIAAFLKKPIIGNGRAGLAKELYLYTNGMNTCTFINWFAIYGIVYGLIMLWGIYSFSRRLADSKPLSFWYVMILFVATISETYIDNPMIIIFVFYGLEIGMRQNDDLEGKKALNN